MLSKYVRALLCVITIAFTSIINGDDEVKHRYISVNQRGHLQQLEETDAVRFIRSPTPRTTWTIGRHQGKRVIFCTSRIPTITTTGNTEFKRFYLSYPLRKQEPRAGQPPGNALQSVFLSQTLDQNCLWAVDIDGPIGSDSNCRVKAAMGDYKDWYLCLGEASASEPPPKADGIPGRAFLASLCSEKSEYCELRIWLSGK